MQDYKLIDPMLQEGQSSSSNLSVQYSFPINFGLAFETALFDVLSDLMLIFLFQNESIKKRCSDFFVVVEEVLGEN